MTKDEIKNVAMLCVALAMLAATHVAIRELIDSRLTCHERVVSTGSDCPHRDHRVEPVGDALVCRCVDRGAVR